MTRNAYDMENYGKNRIKNEICTVQPNETGTIWLDRQMIREQHAFQGRKAKQELFNWTVRFIK